MSCQVSCQPNGPTAEIPVHSATCSAPPLARPDTPEVSLEASEQLHQLLEGAARAE